MASKSDGRRAERERQRETKKARKEELSGATSASERRQIKEKYSESVESSGEERGRQNALRQIERNDDVYGAGSMLGQYQNESVLDSFYDSGVESLTPDSPSIQTVYPDGDGKGFNNDSSGGGSGGGDGANTLKLTICVDGEPEEVTFLTT